MLQYGIFNQTIYIGSFQYETVYVIPNLLNSVRDKRHQACVGVVEGKTRDNLFLSTRLVTI
jgi:hypothetical protein